MHQHILTINEVIKLSYKFIIKLSNTQLWHRYKQLFGIPVFAAAKDHSLYWCFVLIADEKADPIVHRALIGQPLMFAFQQPSESFSREGYTQISYYVMLCCVKNGENTSKSSVSILMILLLLTTVLIYIFCWDLRVPQMMSLVALRLGWENEIQYYAMYFVSHCLW